MVAPGFEASSAWSWGPPSFCNSVPGAQTLSAAVLSPTDRSARAELIHELMARASLHPRLMNLPALPPQHHWPLTKERTRRQDESWGWAEETEQRQTGRSQSIHHQGQFPLGSELLSDLPRNRVPIQKSARLTTCQSLPRVSAFPGSHGLRPAGTQANGPSIAGL